MRSVSVRGGNIVGMVGVGNGSNGLRLKVETISLSFGLEWAGSPFFLNFYE